MTPDTFVNVVMWVAVVAAVGSLCVLYFVLRDVYASEKRRAEVDAAQEEIEKAQLEAYSAIFEIEFPNSDEEERF